jgi:hypothetical protein
MALAFSWAFPYFRELRDGLLDNGQESGVAPRLPNWLSYFDTPDNSLLGDGTWAKSHTGTYWDMAAWLYRNSLYGYQWSVLAAPIFGIPRIYNGSRDLNHHTNKTGVLRVTCASYWQYKAVTPFILGYCWVLNFGWILDDESQLFSMYTCSIRIRKLGS